MSEEPKKPEGSSSGWKGALDSAKDVALEIYRDGFKESVQVLGHALAMTVRVTTAPLVFALSHAESATKRLFENADRKLIGVAPEARLLVDPSISAPIILNHALLGDREDAEELRDMYASQLASAIDPATASGAHPSYTQIIAGLSRSEAKLIKALAHDAGQSAWPLVTARIWAIGQRSTLYSGPYYWSPDLESSRHDVTAQIDNLKRLGLVAEEVDGGSTDETFTRRYTSLVERVKVMDGVKGIDVHFGSGLYYFTLFGEAFYEVCVRDG